MFSLWVAVGILSARAHARDIRERAYFGLVRHRKPGIRKHDQP